MGVIAFFNKLFIGAVCQIQLNQPGRGDKAANILSSSGADLGILRGGGGPGPQEFSYTDKQKIPLDPPLVLPIVAL